MLLAVPVVAAHAFWARDRIARGVTVSGIDVGGRSVEDARSHLRERLLPRFDEPITLRVGGRSTQVVPSELGISIDALTSVRRAYRVERVRGAVFPFGIVRNLPVLLKVPRSAVLPEVLIDASRPPTDAGLRLAPDGTATVVEGRDGIGFDVRAALAALARAALDGKSTVTLDPRPVDPGITTAEAERARDRVVRILSAPISVRRGNEASAALDPDQLAPLLRSTPYAGQIGISFDPERVRAKLRPQLEGYLRQPREADYRLAADGTVQVIASAWGIELDADATARKLTAAGLAPDAAGRVARINFRRKPPAFSTRDARALNLTTAISSFTSDMGYSSQERIHNVALLARYLHGTIVKPGTTFSFNQSVGPRTAERGYLEGQAIENGLLVPSIGGGVCQVATTVFNAAFHGGYPISQRRNHSFYISHYPIGLDATVADNGPDLVWTNDTDTPVFIAASASETEMTVSFFSRPNGRTVRYEPEEPYDREKPKERYFSDPAVPDGELVQTGDGEEGFKISVTRTVYADNGDQLGEPSVFFSRYQPESINFKVGKGAKLPAGAVLEPPLPESSTS